MNELTGYSPAPWKEETDENGDVWVVMNEGHRAYIGNMENTCSECHANARLIAKAPELLEEVAELREWKKAVEEACIVNWLSMTTPKETLAELIKWEVTMALDPKISKQAQELVEMGATQERHNLKAQEKAVKSEY